MIKRLHSELHWSILSHHRLSSTDFRFCSTRRSRMLCRFVPFLPSSQCPRSRRLLLQTQVAAHTLGTLPSGKAFLTAITIESPDIKKASKGAAM